MGDRLLGCAAALCAAVIVLRERLIKRHGVPGLRATRLQIYRETEKLNNGLRRQVARKPDCAACDRTALLSPEFLLRLGLDRHVKVPCAPPRDRLADNDMVRSQRYAAR